MGGKGEEFLSGGIKKITRERRKRGLLGGGGRELKSKWYGRKQSERDI